ncbi:hypothetical protein [Actinomadura sp. HBU206391]|uniref:hypothetical protein n=1 Tax=Actinomadura sp. HBU206391 TaxID=2731692 RepID=UPI00164F4D6D|nr:hypothetical protein [Actinomadura sp. HBU206391]MBC6456972.1 hypothetical protein [Actinomadura sp. HBU206391]
MRRDAGEGPVSYLLVLLIIALIIGLLAAAGNAGIGGTVTDNIEAAICRVYSGESCKPKPPPPKVDPYEPKQDCWTDITDRTGELAVTVDIRYFAVRGGHRVTMTTRRVLEPDGKVRYDVIVSPNVELGVATPVFPGNVDPLVWAVLQGTAGRIYSFPASQFGGDENKTKDAALKFADKLWIDQAQNDALAVAQAAPLVGPMLQIPGAKNLLKGGGNWFVEKTSPLTKHLPFIGDNIERATQAPDRDVNDPDQSFYEGGPSVGFNLDVAVVPGKLSLWAAGRGFLNVGNRINHKNEKYHNNYYLKLNGEGDAAFNLSLDAFLPKRKNPGGPDDKGGGDRKNVGGTDKEQIGTFEDWVNRVEKILSEKTGQPVTLPTSTKSKLQAIWPMVGLDIKGKAARMQILSTDTKGRPTQLRTITEWQWIFSWRALAGVDELLTGKHRKGGIPGQPDHNIGVGFVQGTIAGRKYLTQSILDLDGPEHAENLSRTADYFQEMAASALLQGNVAGALDFTNLTPEAKAFNDYISKNGQTYRQIYDSDATTFVGFGKTIRGSKFVRILPVFEPETNKLIGAEYLNPQEGWKPWTHCTR